MEIVFNRKDRTGVINVGHACVFCYGTGDLSQSIFGAGRDDGKCPVCNGKGHFGIKDSFAIKIK